MFWSSVRACIQYFMMTLLLLCLWYATEMNWSGWLNYMIRWPTWSNLTSEYRFQSGVCFRSIFGMHWWIFFATFLWITDHICCGKLFRCQHRSLSSNHLVEYLCEYNGIRFNTRQLCTNHCTVPCSTYCQVLCLSVCLYMSVHHGP